MFNELQIFCALFQHLSGPNKHTHRDTHIHTHTQHRRKLRKCWDGERKRDLKFKATVGQQQPLWLRSGRGVITSARTEAPSGGDTSRQQKPEGYRGQPQCSPRASTHTCDAPHSPASHNDTQTPQRWFLQWVQRQDQHEEPPSQGHVSTMFPPERDASIHFKPKVPLSPHPRPGPGQRNRETSRQKEVI